MLRQLFYFYENASESPPKNKISFSDYILSLQNYQKTESYQANLQYWENKFVDIPPGPRLPMHKGVVIDKTERLEGMLENWNALKEKAAKLSVSPGIILLTVYAEVLAAWSYSESFTIVIPSWERIPLHPDINRVVGDFTAMSWLIITRKERTFEEKVRWNHKAVHADLSHRAVSGLKALRMVAMKSGNRSTLTFPIVFTNLDSSPRLQLPKNFRIEKSLSQTPQVQIDNSNSERDGHLHLHWDVAKGLIPHGMTQEMFAGYQRVLERLINDPHCWKELDFELLINAQPAKYGVDGSKKNSNNLKTSNEIAL